MTFEQFENPVQDLRYGLRQLWRSPGFSSLAILCLTLGIGANTAVFSWIEEILFRPYPAVAHQERLLAMAGTARGETDATGISWPDFLDLQRSCTLCDAFFVSKITGSTLNIGERAEITRGSIVSANYFDAIGVHPTLGRGFEPGEDAGGDAHAVAVISYQLWRNRFKSDPQIVGKMQRLNNVPHTIIGVAPEGFYGTFVGWAMHFWVPASMEETFESGGYKLAKRRYYVCQGLQRSNRFARNFPRFCLAARLRTRGHTSPCADRAHHGLAPRLRRPGLCSLENVEAPSGSRAPPSPPGLALRDSGTAVAADSGRDRQVESPPRGT
jgi:hypothetical protein